MSRSESNAPVFLAGNGEMSSLMRAFDWSTTPLGPPESWPQSLRTTVSVLLNSRFPMFLWWGDDLIQFYNDAYRPSLGIDGKHPKALGQRGADCWPETWSTIHPLIAQVRSGGAPTWSQNQLIPIYRNGRLEDVYWTFGYSAVLDESGGVGGVLVICQETTENVRALQQIEASQQLLQNLFRQAPVGMATFRGPQFVIEQANPTVCQIWGRAAADVLGKPLFEALPEAAGQGFEELLTQVLQTGVPFVGNELPSLLDRNGRRDTVYWNLLYQPMREEDGSIARIVVVATDVSEQVLARRKVEASETYLQRIFKHTAVAIAIFRGSEFVIEVANPGVCTLWGRTEAQVLGKPLFEALPEIVGQGFEELLTQVLQTGQPFTGTELPGTIYRNGRLDTVYFDFVYEPLPENDGRVERILVTATEATARVQGRQKIEESEERLNLALEAAELGTWEFDIRRDKVTCSARTAELHGLAPDEPFVLERALRTAAEADRQRVAEAIAQALQPESGGHYAVEYALANSADGQPRLIQARGRAFFDKNGQAYRMIGTSLDITEQKRAEGALRESDRWFRQLADSMPQIVWTAQPDGFLDYYNQRWYDFTGFEESYGDQSWIPILHPDDVQLCVDTWYHSVQTGEPYQIEYRFKHRDRSGEYCWFLGRATPMRNERGEIIKWFGTSTDIDDQKKAEAALQESDRWFRQLADSMPQMVWTTRPDGYHDFYNQRWYDFTGLDYEQTRDQGWSYLLHPDDYGPTYRRWQHSLETGESYEMEYRMRQHDGQYCWLLARATPMHNEQGEIIKWFGTCTDIREQKTEAERLEKLVQERTRQLLDLNADLERSNLDLLQFAFVASHDLKEPLRKIQMFGGLLEHELKESLSERARQHLDVMIKSATRMQLLVEDVLNLSRLSQRDVTYAPVDLNAVVASISSDLQVLIQEKGARIETGTLPPIRAVTGQMHQLFQNLISNGLKFNESPLPVITIQSVGYPAGTHVVIEVSDNGIGFAEEFREKMFGMFQRLNGRTYAGTGIGLTICRKIVDNHRGTIEAFSRPGQGSTFRVTLPV